MQPVQDLTVEDRVSRTQYQYSLEDPDAKELASVVVALGGEAASARRDLRDVASDQQNTGLQTHLVIDRNTASRLGITPQMIDDTLYDAFGQRQVSIMFTQLNQYRVVLEIKPEFQHGPAGSEQGLPAIRCSADRCRWPPSRATSRPTGRWSSTTRDSSRSPRSRSISRPAFRSATRSTEIEGAKKDLGIPPSVQTDFQGTARAFITSLANEPILILAAVVTVYIVLGVLYESYIHPITILSTLPSAAVGALLALMICHEELSVIGLIGIVLLIGIVEKNAIMMIDFALEKERKEGEDAARGDLPGLPAALPADHHDDHGGAAGRRAAGARLGHRAGTAAAARHHDRGRPDLQPVAHALHHARDLPRIRQPREETAAEAAPPSAEGAVAA